MYMYLYIYIYTYMHIWLYIYIYIYIYTCVCCGSWLVTTAKRNELTMEPRGASLFALRLFALSFDSHGVGGPGGFSAWCGTGPPNTSAWACVPVPLKKSIMILYIYILYMCVCVRVCFNLFLYDYFICEPFYSSSSILSSSSLSHLLISGRWRHASQIAPGHGRCDWKTSTVRGV